MKKDKNHFIEAVNILLEKEKAYLEKHLWTYGTKERQQAIDATNYITNLLKFGKLKI